MHTVYKYEFPVEGQRTLPVPEWAKILKVGDPTNTGTQISIWMLVDPEAPLVERTFAIVGTGQPLPGYIASERYVDTVIAADGRLVWHVFEVA